MTNGNVGFLSGIIDIFFDCVLLAYYIVYMIAEYRILQKEGEKGWKALVPFYNFYVTYKIEGVFCPWFYFITVCTAAEIVEFVFEIMKIHSEPFEIIFKCASLLAFITEAVFSVHLGRSFGKSLGFKVGLVLLPDIFYLILAFGKSTFIHHTEEHEDSEQGDNHADLPNSRA